MCTRIIHSQKREQEGVRFHHSKNSNLKHELFISRLFQIFSGHVLQVNKEATESKTVAKGDYGTVSQNLHCINQPKLFLLNANIYKFKEILITYWILQRPAFCLFNIILTNSNIPEA